MKPETFISHLNSNVFVPKEKKNFKHIWIISHHNDLRRMVPQMRGEKIVRNKKALKMELELTTFKLSKLISTILKIQ